MVHQRPTFLETVAAQGLRGGWPLGWCLGWPYPKNAKMAFWRRSDLF